MPRPFSCPKCSRRAFTLVKLIHHFGLIHSHEADFSICCCLDDCQCTFTKYESYRRHIYRKHKKWVVAPQELTVEDEEVEENAYENNLVEFDEPSHADINTLTESIQKMLMTHSLKWREKHVLPQLVQQDITDDVAVILSNFKEQYDTLITQHLEQKGFSLSDCPEFAELFQSPDLFSEAANVVHSKHLFTEYCKSNLDLTESVQYILRDSLGSKVGTCSYVPIIDVLKKYCSHNDIWEHIQFQNNQLVNKDVLTDYRDGLLFKEHPFFKIHSDALRLHFYQDEFEVVNPLGAKRGKYKLSAVYYTIGNLHGK
ncbi:uncharacterized protein LOC132872868 [Neoarius graeffei]|uniref:uncharacterized protein LOC132872868 n=1 Tax=Neoarius graeffei TaxID=443677 RepID=UPI00298CB95E|nr:uncharacterized protein LOC132872868 [Neoarius graeffei]